MSVALIAGAATLGALAGWPLARNLARLTYRRPHETHLPAPSWHRWLPALTAAGAALVATTGSWERLTLAAPLLTVGIWLASVDADVQRLPLRHVITLTALETLAAAAVAITHRDPAPALVGLAAAALAYVGFRLLHHASNGRLGYGDATLAGPLALAVTTAGGLVLVWAWLLLSLTAAALYGRLRRHAPQHALGPWLIFGAIAALAVMV